MREFLSILWSYIKHRIAVILVLAGSAAVFWVILLLYSMPVDGVAYATLLAGVFVFLAAIIGLYKYYKRVKVLKMVKKCITLPDFYMPEPKYLLEKEYQELVRQTDKNRTDIINEKDSSYEEMMEYYTIWVHQIKTPIAAMRLLLQSEKTEANEEFIEQLFKIEEYVEMVLHYLRMEGMSNDLLLTRYSLDKIIKAAVRKYSKFFIRKKIRLNYEPLNREVLTDEKWLTFVIEQILSNALKYTNQGEISIYMDENLPCTLVIEDTGIGIAGEDLPRVFEKGFTGYIGRSDKKSTGIGLYLCKKILTKLSHTISIESEIDKGTRVKIGLDTVERVTD